MAQLVRIFAFIRIKWRSRFRQNRKDKEAGNKRLRSLPPSASTVAIISPVKSAGAVVKRGTDWLDVGEGGGGRTGGRRRSGGYLADGAALIASKWGDPAREGAKDGAGEACQHRH